MHANRSHVIQLSVPKHFQPTNISTEAIKVSGGLHLQASVVFPPAFEGSLWALLGLDKEKFYAAALYLHVAVGSLDSRPWSRGSRTP